MNFYKVEYSKKEDGWVVKKRGTDYKDTRVSNSPSFSTIEEAEKWIKENHVGSHKYDRPWIDHTIDGSSGHLMPLQEWKKCCDGGGFIDYDGYGSAVDEKYTIIQLSDPLDYEGNYISPSDYTEGGGVKIPENTKYILWYNR